MAVRDTSMEAFEGERKSGRAATLRQRVYEAILTLGVTHNKRILEYLQQKESQRYPVKDRIEWTVSNCWPRVTKLQQLGHVVDCGKYRGVWKGRKKTLTFFRVKGIYPTEPVGWEKVERKLEPLPAPTPAPPKIYPADRAYQMNVTQAASVLGTHAQSRHKLKTQPKQGMLF